MTGRGAATAAILAAALAGCGGGGDLGRAVEAATRAEAEGIRQVMLTMAQPEEAVAYFQARIAAEPDDLAHRRGLAQSLVRAGRPAEGVQAWRAVVERAGSAPEDRVELAGALVRVSEWTGARAVLDGVPPTHETFERYRLEAMVADSARQWDRADSFYETAAGLTTTPAGVLNNWGYSKLSRGDAEGAERLLTEAITADPTLFTAKSNLVVARAARRDYALPIVPMTQDERARLLHTAGLAAVRRGDTDIGRTLLREAVDTAPRHFEAAVRALEALDA